MYGSSGMLVAENMVFTGCGRRGSFTIIYVLISRLGKPRLPMRVLNRLIWLRAVRIYPGLPPEIEFWILILNLASPGSEARNG